MKQDFFTEEEVSKYTKGEKCGGFIERWVEPKSIKDVLVDKLIERLKFIPYSGENSMTSIAQGVEEDPEFIRDILLKRKEPSFELLDKLLRHRGINIVISLEAEPLKHGGDWYF